MLLFLFSLSPTLCLIQPYVHPFLLFITPPCINMGYKGGGWGLYYWNYPILLSCCVRTLSPEPLNHFLTKLGVVRSVRQKKWFTVFKVKVTARNYIIKL